MAAPASSFAPRKTGLALGLGLSLLVALPLALGALGGLEGRVYDLLLRARSDRPSGKVVLVCIDPGTWKALGGRDPDRAELAEGISKLWAGGADLIGLDLLLVSPKGEREDGALAAALSEADCVLATNPTGGMVPLAEFRQKAVGVGSIELLTDRDGILRKIPPPYAEVREGSLVLDALPFSLECARLEWFKDAPPVPRIEAGDLVLGSHRFPLAPPGWRIPYFGGDGTLARISFASLLGGSAPPDVKGRVVLVGNTQASKHDYFAVPLPAKEALAGALETAGTHTMAGVEVQGQALDALLQGLAIRPPSAAERWGLFGLLAALGTGMTALPLKPVRALAAWLLLGAALAAGSVLAMRAGIALPALALGTTWLAFAGTSFAYHRYLDFSERRAVERLFSRYVSPNVARQLLERPELVHLGGHRKVVTILFSDIRGFTTLSEQIPPEQVSDLLNLYFTEMTRILFRFDGTLDKFIGDAILAFFGDPLDLPDHPARALACAVAMQEAAASLRERFRAEGRPELRIGVAVNTGPVIVGNNGAENNFVYTVIGDAVNLTARLQGLAQRDDVILTEATAALVPGFGELYRHEEMEPVMVKGKAEPVSIVRVLGRMKEGVAP